MLKARRIAELVEPYFALVPRDANYESSGQLFDRLEVYLELLIKWNGKTNLTAIREPEEIVRRHFGESLFVGGNLSRCETLLDFGSGAGFPGLPILLLRPAWKVTLAESQGKKAAFLREAIRTLGLEAEIWSDRVESMPTGRRFDVVVMRAVDNMRMALAEAGRRVGAELVVVGTDASIQKLDFADDLREVNRISIPSTLDGLVVTAKRKDARCSTWNALEATQI